jgi:hypothetical protein
LLPFLCSAYDAKPAKDPSQNLVCTEILHTKTPGIREPRR